LMAPVPSRVNLQSFLQGQISLLRINIYWLYRIDETGLLDLQKQTVGLISGSCTSLEIEWRKLLKDFNVISALKLREVGV
jgi:hypothetical protein